MHGLWAPLLILKHAPPEDLVKLGLTILFIVLVSRAYPFTWQKPMHNSYAHGHKFVYVGDLIDTYKAMRNAKLICTGLDWKAVGTLI